MPLQKSDRLSTDELSVVRRNALADHREIDIQSFRAEAMLANDQHRREEQELVERDILIEERERAADLRDDLLYERELALHERERRVELRERDIEERLRQQDRGDTLTDRRDAAAGHRELDEAAF